MIKNKLVKVLSFVVLATFGVAVHAATCPPISTAIQQINAAALGSAIKTSDGLSWHYTATLSDETIVDYYTVNQPTVVAPDTQLKLLAPALKTGIPLSVASGSTSVACAYLGSATGTAPDFTPIFNAWNQVIVITSSGVVPPTTVAATVTITGDLASLAGHNVPVTLSGTTNYGPVTIKANDSAIAFGTINTGSYTAGPATLTVNGTVYHLQSSAVQVTAISPNITLEYDTTPPSPTAVAATVTIRGDLTSVAGESVPVALTGPTSYGPISIAANGSAIPFGTINTGSYTVAPIMVTANDGNLYHLQSSTVQVTTTNTNISLEYDKIAPATVAATVTITGDLISVAGENVPVSLTGATSYGPISIAANGSAIPFGTINTGFYTAGPPIVTVNGTAYHLQSSAVDVTTTGTNITLEYDKTAPIMTLPGWPRYVAMGNITTGSAVFQTTDTAHPDLDAAYTYDTINGDASIGNFIALPDPTSPSNSAGNGWHKVFYLMHDQTITPQPTLSTNTIPVVVYYSDDAGSNGISEFGDNGTTCATRYLTGQPDHESLGNLTLQYANLLDFIGLLHYEAEKQPGVVADYVFNPDLLGSMLQSGGATNNIYLTTPLPNINNALNNAVAQVTVPQCPVPPPAQAIPQVIQIDPWVETQLTQNNNQLLSSIEAQIQANGGLTGKGYLNSLNIISKNLLNACGSACANIQFGWQLNAFLAHGSANNLDPAPSPTVGIQQGDYAATWLATTGLFSGDNESEFILYDKYEADGLSSPGASNGEYWNTTTWGNYIGFMGEIAHVLSVGRTPLPVILWQIPASHIPDATAAIDANFPLASAGGASRVDDNTNYFFGNTFGINLQAYSAMMNQTFADVQTITGGTLNAKYTPSNSIGSYIGPVSNFQQSHMSDLTAANVVAILWGGGTMARTTGGFCITPGTCGAGSNYNDDNGWMSTLMGTYYTQGGYPLPGLK